MNDYFVLVGGITLASKALKILEKSAIVAKIVKINNKNKGCGWAIDSKIPSDKIISLLTSNGIKILGRFPKNDLFR